MDVCWFIRKKKWLDCWFVWKYSGTPLIWSLMGQNKLAKLMDDCINEGFFTRKCIAVLPGSQKRGQIMKWPYCCITVVAIRRGFTVLHGLKAYGNNFSYIFLFLCLFVSFFLSYRESYCYVISILWEAQDVSKSNFCEFVKNVTCLQARLEKGSMS